MSGYEAGKDKKLDEIVAMCVTSDELSPFIRAVIYGPFGVGKSVLSATAGKKILYIDSGENGWTSLLNHPDLRSNIAVRIPFKNVEQLQKLAEAIAADKFPFDIDCIVMDTVSAMQKIDLDQVMAYRCKRDPEKDPNTPATPDYNANNTRMRRMINAYLPLQLNFVMVLQDRSDKDQVTGIVTIRPELPDKLGKAVAQSCHLIAYMDMDGMGKDAKRILQCHPTKNLVAKCRIKNIPTKVESPDLREIFSQWNN